MNEYHKINSVYKRNQTTGQFIEDEWSCPEFSYLADNDWIGEEKIDGTNIRVILFEDNIHIKGKTDKAQIPTFLLDKLKSMFSLDLFKSVFPGATTDICIYGEGCGVKVQRNGGMYTGNNGVDFILFDVKIGHWWLQRKAVRDIAAQLGVRCSVEVFGGTLHEAIDLAMDGISSTYDIACQSEGLVLRPAVDLLCRSGQRIITKVKCKDFTHKE